MTSMPQPLGHVTPAVVAVSDGVGGGGILVVGGMTNGRKMPDNIFSHIGAAIDPPEEC